MNQQKGSFSAIEFTLAVFCFVHGTVLRSGYIISITRQDSWITAIFAFFASLIPVAIYGALMKKYPGRSLAEINELVFGRIVGKIFTGLYFFFFLSLTALNTRDAGNFVTGYTMPETPLKAISVFFLFACAYAVKKGIHHLIELAPLIFTVTVTTMVFYSVLSLKDADFDYLLPMLRQEPVKYVQGTLTLAAVPKCEILSFMMLAPMLKENKKAGKCLVLGLVLSTLGSISVMLRDTTILGPLVSVVSLPTFESIRYTTLTNLLSRLESLYAIVLVLLYLFKVSVLLYATVASLEQIFAPQKVDALPFHAEHPLGKPEPSSSPPLLFILTALVLFYSNTVFESVTENMNWAATTAPFFSLTFEFLLPAVTLLVAVLRGAGRKKAEVPA